MNGWCAPQPRVSRRTAGSRDAAPASSANIICRRTAASVSPRPQSAFTARRINDWSGRWTLIVLPPMRAAERKDTREELIWRGFGELSANVFAHPELDSRTLRAQRRAGWIARKVIVFEAASADDAPQRLVEPRVGPGGSGRRYRRFVERFERVHAALRHGTDIDEQAASSCARLLIHEYRRLHLRDPLLPAQLLRADWPGAQAALLCRDIYARVFKLSDQVFVAGCGPARWPPAAGRCIGSCSASAVFNCRRANARGPCSSVTTDFRKAFAWKASSAR